MDFLKKALLSVLVVGIAAGIAAQDNAEAVTVGIKVTNDRAGIIEAAFAKVLFDSGIQISKDASTAPYMLEVNITIEPQEGGINPFKFVRIILDSKLSDNDTVILPYYFNDREGYPTQAGAEQRAYNLAAKKIAAEYGALLDKLKEESKL